MARPIKYGLEYFPLDVAFDMKMEMLINDFGSRAIGVIVKLYQKIYSNCYFVEWNDDVLRLFARQINEEHDTIKTIVDKIVERGFFDKELLAKYGILTSRGVQKQYLQICKDSKRKKVKFIQEYCLVENTELFGVITESIQINSESFGVNTEFSTQSKEKESKEKESKEKKIESIKKEPSLPYGNVPDPPVDDPNKLDDGLEKKVKEQDFIDECLEVWADEYRKYRPGEYEFVYRGKDRAGVAKLVSIIKRKHKESAGESIEGPEEMFSELRTTFAAALQIEDNYFRNNMTPMLLVAKFNEIKNILKNGNGKKQPGITDDYIRKILERDIKES